ncbi:MAG: trehalose-phosphatase [Candidatus Aminicenantes bacterium]|nr:trehalose-phosphatase [Candidatus Aminicenantes bacterium]
MNSLLRAARDSGPLLLFLDFDGTLVPLQTDPERVRLSPSRANILAELARRYPTAVVSGRSLQDIRSKADLPGLAWAGNHGLEVRQGRTLWIHPGAKKAVPALKRAVRDAEIRLNSIPGVRVDDKGLSASVHFRLARPGCALEILRVLQEIVPADHGRLRLTRGKKVFEIRPAVDWDKGKAVLCLMDRLDPKGRSTPLFLGDDRTDEDAFRALAGRGLTVRVGGDRGTAARYRLPDVAAVWRFLQALLLL